MALRPVELRLGDLRLEGWSRAGDETWIRVHPPGLAFDVGRGAPQLAGARDVFLSHGHLDHALGLPYVLSQRSLHHAAGTRVFCPQEIAGPLADLVRATEALERSTYHYEILPLAPGDRVPVARDLEIQAFATDHVVPSLGYHLRRHKHRLRPDLAGLPPAELIALRESGHETDEPVDELWLTYCGDTGPQLFTREPLVFTSRVLLLECTFLTAEHRDRGDRYKHLHLQDLIDRQDLFENQHLVLHHLSRRHSQSDLREALATHLPRLKPEVHLLVEGGAP